MKRLILFVLVLAIAVNADDKFTNAIAEKFESDAEAVQECVKETGTTVEELVEADGKWKAKNDDDDIDDETKELLKKHNNFIACMLEKKEMMKDSKLILDKILVTFKDDKNLPKSRSEESLTECVNTLNDNEMTREDRAFGLMLCMFSDEYINDKDSHDKR